MADKKIIISAEVQASLKGMDKVVSQLSNGLNQAGTKLDISKGAGANVSKLIGNFKDEYSKFQSLTKDGLDIGVSKEALKSGQKLIDQYRELQRIVGDFKNMSIGDAKKLFPEAFDKRVDSAAASLNGLSKSFEAIDAKQASLDRANTRLQELKNKLAEFDSKVAASTTVEVNVEEAKTKLDEVKSRVTALHDQLQSSLQSKLDDAKAPLNSLKQSLQDATKAYDDLQTKYNGRARVNTQGHGSYDNLTANQWATSSSKKYTDKQKETATTAIKEVETAFQARTNAQTAYNNALKETKRLTSKLEDFKSGTTNQQASIAGKEGIDSTAYRDAIKEQTEAQNELNSAKEKEKQLNQEKKTQSTERKKITDSIDSEEASIKKLNEQLSELSQKTNFSSISQQFSALGITITEDMLKSSDGIAQIQQQLINLDQASLNRLITNLQALGMSSDQAKSFIESFGVSLRGVSNDIQEFDNRAKNIDALKNRISYFFGLTNSIMLLRRTLTQTITTVKELDKVMTEAAVVTDFTVSNMWEQLPDYTKRANELGVATKSVYEAATLYYQQGLKTNQVAELTNSTLRMARIAGLDAAEATDRMTNALRGFNMELNQTNADRVADVYSKLAAITASNVDEISTAMTKTASIAASAGMEFETTAAFLSQIIETTRESAETAGTALKTVIARFQELKKSPAEIGEVDGEVVDANKIETALRSVQISLRDTSGQFRDLDDVFLELAKKWDSLDKNTQRYIATQAAGSRQQSRFIAMMSNYAHTMDLVAAANTAAGSSTAQYEKTLDSLESKLSRLSNAWDSFTMGITNSDIIKFGVDALTTLIQIINKLTDALPGPAKGIAKLGVAMIGFKTGAKIFNAFFLSLKNNEDIVSAFSQVFSNKLKTQIANQAAALNIYNTELNKSNAYTRVANNVRAKYGGAIGENTVLTAGETKILEKEALSQEAVTAAKANYVTACELSTTQQAAYDAMVANGIDSLVAAQAAQGGLTASKYAEIMADTALTAEQKEATIARYKKLAALHLENQTTLSNIGLKILNKVATSALTKDTYAQIIAEKLLTKAAQSNTVAMLINLGVIGLIIAAVLVLILAIRTIVKLIKNSTPEEKLKQAQSAAANAGEAAEKAAESYNTLKESLDNLSNSSTNLEELTVGTKEWRDAVQDVNSQVLDLVKNYSALGAYVESENGILSINYEKEINGQTASDVINSYAKQVTNAQSASIAVQIAAAKAQENVEYKNLSEASKIRRVGTEDQTDQGATEKLALAIANGELAPNEEAIKKYAQEHSLVIAGNLEDVIKDLQEFGLSIKELKDAQDAYTQALVSNAYEISGVNDNLYTNYIQNIDSNYLNDSMQKQLEASTKDVNKMQRKKVREEYAKRMGYTVIGNRIYDQNNEEVEINMKTMRSQLAAMEATDAFAEHLSAINDTLASISPAMREGVQALLSTDGADITNETIADLVESGALIQNSNGEYSIDSDLIDNLAKSMGMTAEEVVKLINDNLDKAQDRLNKSRLKTANALRKYGQYADTSNKRLAEIYAGFEEDYGMIFSDTVNAIVDSLEGVGDSNLISNALNGVLNGLKDGTYTSADLENLSSFISGVDWENPIEAVDALNKAMKNGTPIVQDYANSLLSVNSELYGASAQMQYLLKSSDFTEIEKDLKEILKTQDEITAADINDLRDKYDSLDKMIEQTGVTTAGVAKIFTLISENKLDINNISDAVMAAVSAFDSLNSTIADTLDKLEDFDSGVNENDVTDFISEAYDVISENLSKDAYGNSQIGSYFDFLFGEDWDEDLKTDVKLTGDALKKRIDELTKKLKENQYSMRSAWTDLANGKNVYGQTFNKNALEGLEIARNGSQISLSGYAGKTTDKILGILQSAYGVSREYAEMMLTDFKNYSVDLANELAQNDYAEGIKKAYDELNSVLTYIDDNTKKKVKIIDTTEIQAIADIYGKTFKEVYDAFEQSGAVITEFYDKDGLLKDVQDIYNEINKIAYNGGDKAGQNWIDKFTLHLTTGDVTDWNSLLEELGNFGIPESERGNIAQQLITEFKTGADEGANYIVTTLSDGLEHQIEIQPDVDIATSIANAEEEIKNSNLAAAFAEQFKDIQIQLSFNWKTGTIEGNINKIQSEADDNPIQLTTEINEQQKKKNWNSLQTFFKNNPLSTKVNYFIGEEITPIGASGTLNTQGNAFINKYSGTSNSLVATDQEVSTHETNKQNWRYILGIDKSTTGGTVTGYGDDTNSNADKGSSSQWKNAYDWLYNKTEDINELLRERNKLEARYELLISQRKLDFKTAEDYYKETLKNLNRQFKKQQEIYNLRKKEMQATLEENKAYSKYATYNWQDNTIEINWDELEKLNGSTNEDLTNAIEEYISSLEDIQDKMDDASDSLDQIKSDVQDIRNDYIDSYIDFEDRVISALEQIDQDEIDALEDINDSLSDASDDLINAIENSINKIRQDRDNANSEEEIAKKERRLAYLRQDTSGANRAEILSLEEELKDLKIDYSDTIVDQTLEDLRDTSDEAKEQREKQIELLQSQLDWNKENAVYANEAMRLIQSDIEGVISVLSSGEDWNSFSELRRKQLIEEATVAAAKAALGKQILNEENLNQLDGQKLSGYSSDGKEYTITSAAGLRFALAAKSGDTMTGGDGSTWTKNKDGSVTISKNGTTYTVSAEDIEDLSDLLASEGITVSALTDEEIAALKPDSSSTITPSTNITYSAKVTPTEGLNIRSGKGKSYTKLGAIPYNSTVTVLDDTDSDWWKISYNGITGWVAAQYLKKFKTGGLADFTGLAWLDGSKSKPEAVLNAQDTQNLIQLRDILRNSLKNLTSSNMNNSYNIDVNVQSISNDYDVDSMVERIRQDIVTASNYRNVAAVSRAR